MKDRSFYDRITLILALLLLLALLAPMLLLGRCAVPSADDYGYSGRTHLAWEATGSIPQVLRAAAEETAVSYFGWQGTHAAIFLMALQPALFRESLYALTPLIMAAALAAGVFSLSFTVYSGLFGLDRRAACLFAAAVCCLCTQLLPSPVQGFYWYNGSIFYVFFFGLSLCAFSLAARYYRLGGAGRLALLLVLAVLLGGGNYTTALSCAIVGVGTLLILWIWRFPRRRRLLPAVLTQLASFAVSALAPGNAVRQAVVPPGPGPVGAILLSFRSGLVYGGRWLTLPLLGTLALMLPLMLRAARRSPFRFRLPAVVTLGSYCLLSAMFCPPLYATGSVGDGRLLNIIYFAFVFLAVLNLFYWTGWAVKRRAAAPDDTPVLWPRLLLCALLAVCCVLYMRAGHGFTSVGALGCMRSGEAQAFRACYERRLRVLEDDAVRSALLEPYPTQPYLLYFDDIETDPEAWANAVMSAYYGKDAVALAAAD